MATTREGHMRDIIEGMVELTTPELKRVSDFIHFKILTGDER